MTLLREYATCLGNLLDGHTATFHGRYVNLDDVRLAFPPKTTAELIMAATGPRTLELSGQIADGTILTSGTRPDGVSAAIEHIDRGRRTGSERQAHDVVAYVPCVIGDDPMRGDQPQTRRTSAASCEPHRQAVSCDK